MEKRYQVFVSSTYADLKEERQHVLQALMEMDCIPAGMELFPAADQEQWEFIKTVIDDCDYYLLIIGGRYGSTSSDGISYTEKEFNYAVEKGLKIVALIHGQPNDIPFGKSEQDAELREKLLNFKDKVMDGRLVKFWNTANELPGLVALSMQKTIKMYPAIGWVRANNLASEELLIEINDLRKANASLNEKISKLEAKPIATVGNLVDIDSSITIHGTYSYHSNPHSFEYSISWKELFSLIAPYLVEHPNDKTVKEKLARNLKYLAKNSNHGYSFSIDDQEFKTITIQLKAYGLVSTRYSKTTQGGMALFWSLTKAGEELMVQTRVVTKNA